MIQTRAVRGSPGVVFSYVELREQGFARRVSGIPAASLPPVFMCLGASATTLVSHVATGHGVITGLPTEPSFGHL